VEVLGAVPGAAESLEHGFGEGRDARGEPRGHGVLDRQVRPVSSGRPQELARQERLAGHPVSVIGRRVRPVGAPSFGTRPAANSAARGTGLADTGEGATALLLPRCWPGSITSEHATRHVRQPRPGPLRHLPACSVVARCQVSSALAPDVPAVA
jgi:hypothetical protein